MGIVIREALASELDDAGCLLIAAFEQYRPPDGAAAEDRETFERYLRDMKDVRSRLGGADLFVAAEAGRMIGAATLCRPYEPIAHPTRVAHEPFPPEWACLRLLGVDPAHRRRGIGRMLVDVRIHRARELGAPVIALHTASMFEVSWGMYRRMGWQRAPQYDYRPLPEIRAEAYILELR